MTGTRDKVVPERLRRQARMREQELQRLEDLKAKGAAGVGEAEGAGAGMEGSVTGLLAVTGLLGFAVGAEGLVVVGVYVGGDGGGTGYSICRIQVCINTGRKITLKTINRNFFIIASYNTAPQKV